MTLSEYLKIVEERCAEVRLTVTQEGYPCFQDVEVLLSLLKKAIEDRDYYINTKWPEGGIAPTMIEVATEELEALIPKGGE